MADLYQGGNLLRIPGSGHGAGQQLRLIKPPPPQPPGADGHEGHRVELPGQVLCRRLGHVGRQNGDRGPAALKLHAQNSLPDTVLIVEGGGTFAVGSPEKDLMLLPLRQPLCAPGTERNGAAVHQGAAQGAPGRKQQVQQHIPDPVLHPSVTSPPLFSGIGALLIRQAQKIVHAGLIVLRQLNQLGGGKLADAVFIGPVRGPAGVQNLRHLLLGQIVVLPQIPDVLIDGHGAHLHSQYKCQKSWHAKNVRISVIFRRILGNSAAKGRWVREPDAFSNWKKITRRAASDSAAGGFHLLGDIGQQGKLAGPLDGLGQLALMHGAGAGGPAGQDLGALGNEPAQLGGILVINVITLVHAELANLLALAVHGTSRSVFTFHSHGGILLSDFLERQLAVLAVQLGEAGGLAGWRAVAAGGSLVERGRGDPVGRRRIIAAGRAVALAVAEIDVVGLNLRAAAVVALPVLPVPNLQPALHHSHAALGEVLADKLRGLTPGDNVDEVGLLLAALTLEITVDGQGEGRDGNAVLGPPQLRVPGQAAHENDAVEHSPDPPITRPCRQSGNAGCRR